MVFSSATFIFGFFPAVVLLYKAAELLRGSARRLRAQNGVLLFSSLVFYGWGGVRYLLLVLALIAVNYGCGLWMANYTKDSSRRWPLAVGLAADLGVLLICKYFNFIIANAEKLVGTVTGQADFSLNTPVISLPIGISFFTFQIMSYLIDLYRNKVNVQRKFSHLALYVMMFPQLIAGPIVRYADIEKELENRRPTRELEERGLRRFIIGFAKKVLLANAMGSFADLTFGAGSIHWLWAWMGAMCYTLHIFMDFSAYSDMAIGLGWFFGFHFNENFNYPYMAASVRDFWRRWHISLSTWFRDYVYIPLGGSRHGTAKTYRNLLIVFVLTGVWHGAAWQFLLWGLYHGAFLVLERGMFGDWLDKWPAALRHIYALLVVVIGWVPFRADTLPAAFAYLGCMFHSTVPLWNPAILAHLTGEFAFFGTLAVLLSMPVYPYLRKKLAGRAWTVPTANAACWLLLGFSVCYMVGSDYNPFIYFRF